MNTALQHASVSEQNEQELSSLVDERIAEIFGLKDIRSSDDLVKEPAVMGTPGVLSIVRATAYAHC